MKLGDMFVEVQMRLNRSSEAAARAAVQRAADAMDTDAEIGVTVDTSRLPAGVRTAQSSAETIDRMDPELTPEVDNTKLKEGLKESERSVEDSAVEMGKMFARWFAADRVIGEINKAITAASDLEQAVGGSQAVFGEWAHVIDVAASTSAEKMGLSAEAARVLTSQIGGLLKGFGFTREEAARTSVEIAQLGADLAATFGGNPEDAVNALGAALRGEFNPLERYGVALNVAQINLKAVEMGLADSTTQVDLSARAQAALALITERTADAQGQFGREAGMAAGQQAILAAKFEDARAKLGQQLLPIYVQAVSVVSALVDVFSALPGPVQTALVALIGVAAIAGPVRDVTRAFGGLTTMLGRLGTASGPVIALTAAVTIAALAAKAFSDRNEELERRSKEVGTALARQADETFRLAFESEGAETAVEGLAAASRALNESLFTEEDGRKIQIAFGTLGLSSDLALEALVRLGKDGAEGLRWVGEQAGITGTDLDILVAAVNATDANGRDLLPMLYTMASRFGHVGEDAVQTAERLLPIAGAMEEIQDQSEKTDLNKATTEYLTMKAANSEIANSLIERAEAEVGAHRASEKSLDVYLKYGEILATQDQLTQDAVLSTKEHSGAINTATRALIEADPALRRMAEETGALTHETELAIQPVERFGEVVSANTREFRENEAAAKRLDGALDQALGPTRQLVDAQDALHNTAQKLNDSLATNGSTLDRNSAAGQANRAVIKSALLDIENHGLALVSNGKSAVQAALAIQHNTNALENHLVAAGMDRKEVKELIREYGMVPDDIRTVLKLEEEAYVNATLARFNGMIADLPHAHATIISAQIDAGNFELANRQMDLVESKVKGVDLSVLDLAAATGGLNDTFVDTTAETNIFANALNDVEDAADEAEPPVRQLGKIANELADDVSAASVAADDLRRALDRVINPGMDLEQARREVFAVWDELAEAVKEGTTSLDAHTEAGRKNFDMIDRHIQAFWKQGTAMLAAGEPLDDVTEKINQLTADYRAQLIQLGFNERAVDEYLASINATPEGVRTVFEQVGIDQANRAIGVLNTALAAIPKAKTTEISAIVDNPALKAAETLLAAVARQRIASIIANITANVKVGATTVKHGAGGFFDDEHLAVVGDRPEFILPTDRGPDYVRSILAAHPAEAGVVADALGIGGKGTTSTSTLSIGQIIVGSARDLPAVEDRVDEMRWRLAVGGRA